MNTSTTDIISSLLRNVPTYDLWYEGGKLPFDGATWMTQADVLAALTAAMDPAIAERAGEVVSECLQAVENGEGPYRHDWRYKPHKVVYTLTRQITDLLAQNAALRAEKAEFMAVTDDRIEELTKELILLNSSLTATEAKVEKLREELELRDRKDAITDDEIALKDSLIEELQRELMYARAVLGSKV